MASRTKDPKTGFVENLFREVLDSIRHAKEYANPYYSDIEPAVKRQTAYKLRRISELAAHYFLENVQGNNDIERVKADALRYALEQLDNRQ